jgi:hypothetical protein
MKQTLVLLAVVALFVGSGCTKKPASNVVTETNAAPQVATRSQLPCRRRYRTSRPTRRMSRLKLLKVKSTRSSLNSCSCS